MKYLSTAFVFAFVFFLWYGWGSNIYTLYQHSENMTSGQIVIRGVGIPLLPIGVVMGYIGE